MEIDKAKKDLDEEKQNHKATAEILKETEKSYKALKEELDGLNANEYKTNMEVVLI
jgi:hypothetical protein